MIVAYLFAFGYCGARYAQTVLGSRYAHRIRSFGNSDPGRAPGSLSTFNFDLFTQHAIRLAC